MKPSQFVFKPLHILFSDSDSDDDPEKKKMMSKLDAAIVGEKPNVAW